MKKVNVRDIPEESWTSPKGNFAGFGKEISIALGREAASTDLLKRHPFDVEICRIPPGKKPYPYHAHGGQWEFYHVLAGRGKVRDAAGHTAIEAGDVFIFKPGEAHELFNDGSEDLVLYVIADNPANESAYFPDGDKWLVYSPSRRMVHATSSQDYYEGEE